jgi:hypothetical protein
VELNLKGCVNPLLSIKKCYETKKMQITRTKLKFMSLISKFLKTILLLNGKLVRRVLLKENLIKDRS